MLIENVLKSILAYLLFNKVTYIFKYIQILFQPEIQLCRSEIRVRRYSAAYDIR